MTVWTLTEIVVLTVKQELLTAYQRNLKELCMDIWCERAHIKVHVCSDVECIIFLKFLLCVYKGIELLLFTSCRATISRLYSIDSCTLLSSMSDVC